MTALTRRLIRWLEVVGALTLALVLLCALFLWHLNSNDYRREIERAMEQTSGWVVTIDGPLRFALTPLPTAIAADVRIANPPWSERSEMMRAERVEIGFSPFDLLAHRKRLLRLALYGADLHLERDRTWRVNWWNADTALPRPPGGYVPMDIGNLELFDTKISFTDAATGRSLQLAIHSGSAELPLEGPLTGRAKGEYFGTPVTGSWVGGRYADLINDRALWPLSVKLEGAGTSLEATGTIDRPISEMIFDVGADIAGLRLSSLGPVLGPALPALGPYRISTRFSGGWGHYQLAGLKLHLGVSDLSGRLTITTGGVRPRVEGQLQGRLFSRNDLVPAVAAAPVVPARHSDGRLFGSGALPFSALRKLDGRLDLKFGRFITRPLDLFDLETTFDLGDGHLRAMPFRARFAEGRIDLTVTADAATQPPRVHLAGRGEALSSETLLPALGMSQWPTGPMSLELDLTGQGASPSALLAHAGGTLRMSIGEGTLPVRHFDLIASDLVASIMPWADRAGDRTNLNCLVTRFRLRDGLATVERLLIDTGKITVTGIGTVNLASERLDLRFDPRPKYPSLISLATRMRVAGSFVNYSASPDPMGLAKGAAAGLALAISELNPLALMLPFVSIGTGVANPCPGATVAQAQVRGLAVLDPMRGISGLLDGFGRAINYTMSR